MTYLDLLNEAGGAGLTGRATLAARPDRRNPNHHLWNNRGTWWCHFTVHLPDYTAKRVRVSLRTRDVGEARRRRDRLLGSLGAG